MKGEKQFQFGNVKQEASDLKAAGGSVIAVSLGEVKTHFCCRTVHIYLAGRAETKRLKTRHCFPFTAIKEAGSS